MEKIGKTGKTGKPKKPGKRGKALSDGQQRVIDLLVMGQTKRAAAAAVGVAAYTVTRWCQDAEFVAGLNARRWEVYEANEERLRALVGKALGVMEAMLEDENPRLRLQAALQVARMGQQLPAPAAAVTAERVMAEAVRAGGGGEWLHATTQEEWDELMLLATDSLGTDSLGLWSKVMTRRYGGMEEVVARRRGARGALEDGGTGGGASPKLKPGGDGASSG